MPIELIPPELAEEAFVAVGDKLDEKFGGRAWVKPLYWTTVIALFSSLIIYYFW
ncbi:MAG TPA: hypothetical protein QGI72_00295 [Poseidonia sp.]|nr:hypothetical protein [Poseidonia sp.]